MGRTAIDAYKAKKRRLLICKLKREFVYSGPDDERWFRACVSLARTLGYVVEENHRKALWHYAMNRRRRRTLLLGFRGLGKSTICTITMAIKYVLENPNVRILFVSATDGAAKEFLKEARIHLQTNKTLIEMFGQFFDPQDRTDIGRFREGYATVAQRTKVWIREPTFFSIGIGGQTAGRHFEVIFADDLVTDKNSKTQKMREALRSWHDSTLLGAKVPGTIIHYLGTRYYPGDLYDDLQNGRENEKSGVLADCTLVIPMVKNYDDPMEAWVPTSPDRFPRDVCIETRTEMGAYHFLAQMQQDTKTGEGIIFNYSRFKWYDPQDRPPISEMVLYQFFDLTGKETAKGAYFAGITIGVWQSGVDEITHLPLDLRVYVLDLVRERCGAAKQRQHILEAHRKWKPVRAGIEAVQMQAGFAEEIQQGTLLPIEPVELTGALEGNKVLRAMRVSPKVDAGMVYFPVDDCAAGVVCEPLINELTRFPDGDTVDTVDAFVGAMTLAMYGGPKAAVAPVQDDDDDAELEADYSLSG